MKTFEEKIKEAIEIEVMDLSITDESIQELVNDIYNNVIHVINKENDKD